MTVSRAHPSQARRTSLFLVITMVGVLGSFAQGQVTPEEHAKHHPDQSKESAGAGTSTSTEGPKREMMGGGMTGGGMMGGRMMDGMMEKMGAPKPKEMYPKLMGLPDLPLEERAKIKKEAHQRMIDGTQLLSQGLDDLAAAADTDNFQSMQNATALVREGLARFESGLAAHRAIAEGKAPRNVALQWFKREMNLLPTANAENRFRLLGMSMFHTGVMTVLIAFAMAMIWMYFFKMRRATELMKQLAAATPDGASQSSAVAAAMPGPARSHEISDTQSAAEDSATAPDCCDVSSSVCADDEAPDGETDISTGLLRVAKRRLCRLRVARIHEETVDVKSFRLVACHGGSLPFSYLPGQFLTLTLPVSQKSIRRSYTISSAPTQGYYCEISVKREEAGVGSCYLHDEVNEGDTLEAQAPSGRFVFTGSEADSVVLISGGVGITPMMSITRALTDMCWPGEIYFIVACRDPQHFIFQADLKRLEERNSNLHVSVAMSRIQESVDGYHAGRLTSDRLAEWVPDIASRRIHLCGAPPMMEATQRMLDQLGAPISNIHTEDFGSQHKPHVKASQRAKASSALDAKRSKTPSSATVRFTSSRKSTSLHTDETILEAAERESIEIDYSCRTGMCGICQVKLLAGQVSMEVDDGLEANDKAAGMILACQAKSTGDVDVEA